MITPNYNTSLYILISIIVYYIILDEIINLTIFVFKYDKDYDYSKILNSISKNEYIEYETNRFHISNNIIDYSFTNDNYNNKNYILLIVLVSIIISLLVSFIFSQIIYSTFLNNEIIKNIIINDDSKFFIDSYNIFLKLFIIILIILYILISCLIPLYIIFKLIYDIDLSLYNKDNSERYYNKIWYVIIGLLIIFRFVYFIKDNYKNDDERYSTFYNYIIHPFTRYNNLMNNSFNNQQTDYSIFTYLVYFFIFLIVLYYITNVLNIYNDYMKYNDNISDKNDKRYKDRFYENYNNYKINNDILSEFINNILGSSKSNNSINNTKEYENIFISYLPRYIFILLIFLITLTIFYYIIKYISNYNSIYTRLNIINSNDSDILYYCIICPMICILILLIITTMTTEYNTYINKYILYEPSYYYKSDISNINDTFNNILNDMNEYEPTTNICKNIVNTILLTLYSYTFKNINDINQNINEEDEEILINVNPEFTYDDNCNDIYINYGELKEYNIDYYLKNKSLNRNILYDYHNCDKVNSEVLILLIYNLLPITIKKQDLIEIKDNYKINLEQKDYIINYKENIRLNIKKALYNILIHNKNYDGSDIINSIIINDPNIIEIIDTVDFNEFINTNLIKYKYIINHITDEYIKLIIKNLKRFVIYIYKENKEYYNSFDINVYFNSMNIYNDNKELNNYANELYEDINYTFNNINDILINNINKDETNYSSITKYIISNYNNINSDIKYNNLIQIANNKNNYNSINYKKFRYILKYITNIENKLSILYETRNNKDYLNIKYLTDIENIIDDIEYISKYNLKNIEYKEGNYYYDINNMGTIILFNKELKINNIVIILISDLKYITELSKNEIIKTKRGNIINKDITEYSKNTKILYNKLSDIKTGINKIEDVYNNFMINMNIINNKDEYNSLTKKKASKISDTANNVANMIYLIIFIYIILIILIQIIR